MGKETQEFKDEAGYVMIARTNDTDDGRNQVDIYLKDSSDPDDSNKAHFWIDSDGESGQRDLKPKDSDGDDE